MFVLLIKSSLVIVILLAFYKLFLEKESFFSVNRFYLLACLLMALALPFISLPELIENQGYVSNLLETEADTKMDAQIQSAPSNAADQKEILPIADADLDKQLEDAERTVVEAYSNDSPEPNIATETAVLPTEPTNTDAKPKATKGIGFWLFWLYLFGVGILTLSFLAQIAMTLWKVWRNEEKFSTEAGIIVNLEQPSEPCSFFQYIFIHPDSYDFETYEQILAHEKVHVRQRHSLDLILAEIAVILMWFNPFIWLFRKEVEKNIEYQTDALLTQAVKQEEKKDYQLNLLKIATYNKPLTITTNYNQSLIKQRILKMSTKKSNPHSYWKYAFLAPLVFITLLMLNEPNNAYGIDIIHTGNAVEKPLAPPPPPPPPLAETRNNSYPDEAVSGIEETSDCQQLLKAVKKEDLAAIKNILIDFDTNCLPDTNGDDIQNFKHVGTVIENAEIIINQPQRALSVIGKEVSTVGNSVTEVRVTIDLDWVAGKSKRKNRDDRAEIPFVDQLNNEKDCKTLIKAILAENIEAVKVLIKETDVNCIDPNPDHQIIKKGNSSYYFSEPRTPLVAAARKGNLEITQFLVENGAKVNFQASRDETPIMAAAEFGNLEVVKYLRQQGAAINTNQRGEGTVLSVAARGGNLAVVKYIVAEGAAIDAKTQGEGTPLSVAARSGHLAVVKYLLNQGADINSDTRGEGTPLSVAARSDNLEVVKYLLEKGANINADSQGEGTPLSVAARSGNLEVVQYLLEKGANINANSRGEGTPLSVAARSGSLEVVKYLLEQGANINTDSQGEGTPLSVAARSGNLEVVKYLLKKGADINASSRGEGTPLSVAARSGNLEIVKYLLEQNADINASVAGEGTPLSVAARSGHLEIVQFLLDANADIEANTQGEGTPLTVAARSGNLEVVKYLVAQGADIHSHVQGEGTPLYVAIRSGHRAVADYLKSKGASY
ncbi:MAG: ankyrin repeat domain-containing protein [Bacteroidota bacterium]